MKQPRNNETKWFELPSQPDDLMNGDEDIEVPEFVATRHELEQLSTYWKELLEHKNESDADFIRNQEFARKRVDQIGGALSRNPESIFVNNNDNEIPMPRVVANADNEHLAPGSKAGCVTGLVYVVNLAGAEEMKRFVPVRHELKQLLRYWQHDILDIEYFYFQYHVANHSESLCRQFAKRRIVRIGKLLGDEVTRRIIDEVLERFGKDKVTDWHIILHGSELESAFSEPSIPPFLR